jgi:hypothetical protein
MQKNRASGAGRRSSVEWAQLVDDWRDSGLSAREFAARAKVSAKTLSWWKWHLGSSATRPKLVPVEIIPAENEPSDHHAEWEVRSSSGHVLRVFGAISDDDLAAILRVMSHGGSMR